MPEFPPTRRAVSGNIALSESLSQKPRVQKFSKSVGSTPKEPIPIDDYLTLPKDRPDADWIGALGILVVAMVVVSGIYGVVRYLL